MKVFFVGLGRVPYASRACDIRLDSFAELFVKCGISVTILNRYSAKIKQNEDEFQKRNYEVRELVVHGKDGKIGKLLFLWSIIKELVYLINYRIKNNGKVILHIYSGHFLDIFFYWAISKLCGYKIVYQYVEYRMDEQRKNPYHRINALLVDKFSAKLWDGCISISHFLQQRALQVNSKLKTLIGPPICDFTRFEKYKETKENIVLYCGSAGYFEVIKLVVDSFNLSKLSTSYKLELVVAGKESEVEEVRQYASNAIIKSKLPYEELIKCYNRSKILMIPLRNNIKDISRFPNKVCEYAASKSVIVTTRFGEPAHFFKDKESAMIADDYSVASIVKVLNWLADNQSMIKLIGEKGYQNGVNAFHIDAYIEKMKSFLDRL